MRTHYPMRGAQALFQALGGQGRQEAMDAELDRLAKMDLQRSQMGLHDAQATAAREKTRLERDQFDAQRGARNLRMDPNYLTRLGSLRLPELAPADVGRVVRRGMGGPYEMPPGIDPMQLRLLGETLAGVFAGGAADGPTNAEQMANVVTRAGSSAQRLAAPQLAAEDPITAAFMLNAGTDKAAPDLYGALPAGLGTFGKLTGLSSYDAGMKGAAIAKDRASAARDQASAAASSASAAKTRQDVERGNRTWDTDRGGFIDWRTGTFVPATQPDGSPVGPKPGGAGAKPQYDPARGIMINPDGTSSPVLDAQGNPIGGKPLTPEQEARQLKMSREATTARAAVDNSIHNLDRLATEARRIMEDPALGRITGVPGRFPNWPGGAAADVQAKLETLKSQAGFAVLQAMRDASKTGGALGNVSNFEVQALQNNLAALDTQQSPGAFMASLQQIVDYAENVKGRLESAWRDTYADAAAATPANERPPLESFGRPAQRPPLESFRR